MEALYLGAAVLVVYAAVMYKARSEISKPHEILKDGILDKAQVAMHHCQEGDSAACQQYYEQFDGTTMTQPSIHPADV